MHQRPLGHATKPCRLAHVNINPLAASMSQGWASIATDRTLHGCRGWVSMVLGWVSTASKWPSVALERVTLAPCWTVNNLYSKRGLQWLQEVDSMVEGWSLWLHNEQVSLHGSRGSFYDPGVSLHGYLVSLYVVSMVSLQGELPWLRAEFLRTRVSFHVYSVFLRRRRSSSNVNFTAPGRVFTASGWPLKL